MKGEVLISNNKGRRAGGDKYLQTARETAGGASERAVQMDDLLVVIIEYLHVERPIRAAEIPSATVRLLFGVEHFLAHRVLDRVLVGRFKSRESFSQQ